MNTQSRMDLRRIIFHQYDDIRDLSLSKRQVEVIRWANKSPKTSRELADKYNICVQNSSQQLNNLYKKGYLMRVETSDSTGGYIFRYWTAFDLDNDDF